MKDQKEIGLSGFISLEWFTSSTKKEVEPEEEHGGMLKWIQTHTKGTQLNKDIQLKEGTVNLSGRTASIFHRNGQVAVHVFSDFEKDYEAYQSVFDANKSRLLAFGKEQTSLHDALEKIASNQPSLEVVNALILRHKVQAAQFSGHNSIAAKFRQPAIHFLGDYDPNDICSEGYFNTDQTPSPNSNALVNVMTEMEKDDIVQLAFDIGKLHDQLEDMEDHIGLSVDMTESPIRGYIEEIDKDEDVMKTLAPFIEYGQEPEDHNGGLVDVLKKRVWNLHEALWHYIKASIVK